jgi:uncharacterized protein YbjT (DUF2867 family)
MNISKLLGLFALVVTAFGFNTTNVLAASHETVPGFPPPIEVAKTVGFAADDLVVVIGGSGRVGQRAVQQLIDAGIPVRASTRDIAKSSENISAEFDWVEVDVTRIETLEAAMVGVSHVISAIGDSKAGEDIDYQGVVNIVEVAKAAGVKHFSLVSSAGATHDDHFLNRHFNNVLKWKFKGEEHLRKSGLNYTIIRPYALQDELDVHSKFSSILMDQGDDMPNGVIVRGDVAKVCIEALTNPDANKKTLEITGFYTFETGKWPAQFATLKVDESHGIRSRIRRFFSRRE